jgi:redox-sensitive bicupin YhaK (pirin superfamily)
MDATSRLPAGPLPAAPGAPLVRERLPLGPPGSVAPWPTLDPFLFCVHHVDAYPRGDGRLAPAASLAGRQLGSDFEGRDGWRMYHGLRVPGFPQHPHRGFETVTLARRGFIDHADSLGAAARFGRGDVQWLTAGAGIVHSEMFPLLDPEAPNPVELFQLWLNLPAASKMARPHFSMLWGETLPEVVEVDAAGRRARARLIAGSLWGQTPPAPPPESWASRAESDLAIALIALDAGASITVPGGRREDTPRVLYAFSGGALAVRPAEPAAIGPGPSPGAQGGARESAAGVEAIPARHAAVLPAARPIRLTAGPGGAEVLMLQARPIGEPIAAHGPFVMNTPAEIQQAFADYRRTRFGGWPWPEDGPVHGAEPARFARHADGRLERP